MERAGFKLDPIIYSFVVGGFARAGKMKYAKAFYGRMRKCGFEPSEHLYEAFILGFYRAGQLHKAEKTFVQMKRSGMSPSLQLCNLMVEVYQKNKNEIALEEVLHDRKAVKPTKEAEKRKMLDMYLKFHQQFVGSLARDVDDSDNNDAMNVEECYG
jgi:pentatricopeptide repeat protein